MRDKATLIAFEKRVAEEFQKGNIKGPVHLSGGNEDQLIEVFQNIRSTDWVFSTWRNHYHALLHGVPEDKVWREILAGRSMNLAFPEHRFYTSSIVGGILPIAVGVAAGIKRHGGNRRVWCFIGDMADTTGISHEAQMYAMGHNLPIHFVVEDNGLSTNTPTDETWGMSDDHDATHLAMYTRYRYERVYPHYGVTKKAGF